MIAHHITNPNQLFLRADLVGDFVMHDNYANKSAPGAPRCHKCARPMQLLRRTARFGGLSDLYSFYCVACDEWHVEEGEAAPNRTTYLAA
jgi:hypothetical protein